MASDNTGDLKLPADLILQDEILTKIKYSTNADEKLDVESLFSAVENILDRTTKTVDGLFLVYITPFFFVFVWSKQNTKYSLF